MLRAVLAHAQCPCTACNGDKLQVIIVVFIEAFTILSNALYDGKI